MLTRKIKPVACFKTWDGQIHETQIAAKGHNAEITLKYNLERFVKNDTAICKITGFSAKELAQHMYESFDELLTYIAEYESDLK